MELLEYKILLEKYFDGNTSTVEENQLKQSLQNYTGSDTELMEAKQMFQLLHDESEVKLDIDFNLIIKQKSNFKIRHLTGFVSAVAAGLVIVFSLMFLLKTHNPPVVYAYINGKAITDKEVAIQESMQAFSTLKTNLDKGTKGLNYINEMNKPLELLTVKNE